MVRMAIGGVIWTILNLIQNDREKKNERLYIYIFIYCRWSLSFWRPGFAKNCRSVTFR